MPPYTATTLMNRYVLLSIVAVAGLSAWNQSRPQETGWKSIFNGKDLAGWSPKIRGHKYGENFANTFRVKDGVIQVSYDSYDGKFNERFGHLFYKSPFSRYRFRCEYRFIGQQAPDGPGWAYRNSGIMVHGQDPKTMELDQDFPVSAEVQLLGTDAGVERTTGNLCTPGTNVVMDGKLITHHCTNSTAPAPVADAWSTIEIVVDGNKVVEHWVDGKLAMKYEQVQYDPNDGSAKRLIKGDNLMISGGSISLQSESHPVEFRKIEIKPL
ncbi:MAG: 3-keto-disaccharide hydrolase [Fimbriimonas sp.]